tara:strand:- start:1136 stop:1372 length:237 start_codon:yes stop_codon:yes gene_type:complete
MTETNTIETPENGNDHSVNRTRKFAEWLIAREQAKQAEEPIDRQMRMLKINTFLTLAILLAVGGADYNSELLSILWFL